MDEHQLEELKYPVGKFKTPERFGAEMRQEWIVELEALPTWLEMSIENLDAAQLDTPYRPGGWTVKQLVHHVADSHMNGLIRVKMALTEDNPTIKPYLQDGWADLPDVDLVPINVSLTLLHALHRRWGQLLRNLTEEQWNRTYVHPEHGRRIPVWEATAMYAWHSRHHFAHVRNLRDRMNW